MGEAWVKIIVGLLSIIGTITTYYLAPYLKQRTTAQQREDIDFWVRIAVAAAEQIFDIPKSGEKKKQFVLQYLNELNIKVTEQELDVLIEAAVYELNLIKQEVI